MGPDWARPQKIPINVIKEALLWTLEGGGR